MDHMKICIGCQDFEANVGHEAIWCPNIVCQKCHKNGHTKITCMSGHEDMKTLPNEILIKIISYVCDDANSKDKYRTTFDYLDEIAKVSERFQKICETQKEIVIDKALKIQEVTLQSLPTLISVWRLSYPKTGNLLQISYFRSLKNHVRNVLFACPKLTSTLINRREENRKHFLLEQLQGQQDKEKHKVI